MAQVWRSLILGMEVLRSEGCAGFLVAAVLAEPEAIEIYEQRGCYSHLQAHE